MTKIFVIDHNCVLVDIKKHFDVVDDINQADWLFIWNDVVDVDIHLINYTKKLGKKVAVFQHGRYGTSRYYPPFNQKILADVLFVWGENDKKALIEAGQDPSKIVVAGTTVFSHLKGRKKHKGKNIVFSPDHWDCEIEENLKTRDILNKMKGVNIITKLVNGQDEKNYKNVVKSNRANYDHLDIVADVLSTADLVVSVSEGTFELLAQSLDIPVVVVNEWKPKVFNNDPRYKEGYRRVCSNASTLSTYDKLPSICYNELRNPGRLSAQRKEIVLLDGGYNLDTVAIIKERLAH